MSFISSIEEADGHSDDEDIVITKEDGTDEQAYYITEKEGRSAKYTKFYRALVDNRRLRKDRRRGKHKYDFPSLLSFCFTTDHLVPIDRNGGVLNQKCPRFQNFLESLYLMMSALTGLSLPFGTPVCLLRIVLITSRMVFTLECHHQNSVRHGRRS